MALVKEIVQLLGGRMHLSSELGQGTTVTMEFPVALQLTRAEPTTA
jgi:signal transduction histidine kinase